MKIRVLTIAGGMILSFTCSTYSSAQTIPAAETAQIQRVVAQDGRVVYTNVDGNAPASSLAATVPASKPATALSGPINDLIESISGNHGVDSALVKAMVKAESNFNQWAVSSKGALGLMQLIPTTGARYGVRDFFDPRQNIEGGVSYLKFLLGKFNGDLDLSLAAYNAGENLVERLGRIPPIPETRDYVRKVRANYGKSSGFTVTATEPVVAVVAEEAPKIFTSVDERGVFHFSNVAPPK